MLIGLLLKPVSFRSYLLTHLILQNHLSRDPTLRHLKTSESPFNFPFQQFLKANCPNVILYRNILFLPLLSSIPPFFLISQYLSDKPPNLRNTTLFRKAKHKCFFFLYGGSVSVSRNSGYYLTATRFLQAKQKRAIKK